MTAELRLPGRDLFFRPHRGAAARGGDDLEQFAQHVGDALAACCRQQHRGLLAGLLQLRASCFLICSGDIESDFDKATISGLSSSPLP